MLFINCDDKESKMSNSYFNKGEVKLVADLLKHLKQVRKYDIQKFGFVAPYQSQVQHVKCQMQPLGIEENVLTIDSWQGREKEFMIMSAVRSNDEDRIGFLDSYRRINVALTRAQHGLIIIGNRMTLKSDELWSAIIKHFVDNNCYCNNFEEAIEMIKRNSF